MTPSLTGARVLLAGLATAIALVLQSTVFSHLAWQGVVPNLVLLVVVAAALVRGSHFAMVLGFCAGVLLDLSPTADHVAGRWALALLVVGYVAGRLRQEMGPDHRPSLGPVVATVAAASFLGSSVFALSGIVLSDPALAVPDLLQVVLVGVVYDVALAAVVLPLTLRLFSRLEPVGALA